MTAAFTPLRRARIDAAKAHLKARARSAHVYNRGENTVALTKGTYADLRRMGVAKADVDQAADELVTAGQAKFLVGEYSGVTLKVLQ